MARQAQGLPISLEFTALTPFGSVELLSTSRKPVMQPYEPLKATFSFVASFLAVTGAGNAQDDLLRMEAVIQSYVSSNQFMGAILVARNDQILLN